MNHPTPIPLAAPGRAIPAADVSAVLLAASVAGVEAGRGVVRALAGLWLEQEGRPTYRETITGADPNMRVPASISNDGLRWRVGFHEAEGTETGPEGRAAADAALLRLGYAYLDPAAPFGVVVPTFDLEKR